MKTNATNSAITPAKSKSVIGALLRSKIFHDYQSVFEDLTGLKITLEPIEAWPLPHRAGTNPLCALLGTRGCSCVCCRRAEKRIATGARTNRLVTVGGQCHCGAATPLWLGRQLVGIVQVIAPMWAPNTGNSVSATVPSLTPKQHAAALKLIGLFAKHLAAVSNQIVLQTRNVEPPIVTRAKAYIANHCTTNLSLGQTARAMNLSTFYFCKLFKKNTGIKFSEYLSRVRVEKAKHLLLNRNVRISEVAFEVGFQSLTHFNRMFKNLIGVSPKEFRKQSVIA